MKRWVLPAILLLVAGLAGCGREPTSELTRFRKRDAAKLQIHLMHTSLEVYDLDMGGYPTTAQGLEALRRPPATAPNKEKWDGPYLVDPVPNDPWGRPYQYEYSEGDEKPRMWSLGPDRLDGTADDVILDDDILF